MNDEKFLISGGIPRVLGEIAAGHVFKKAELAVVDYRNSTYTAVLNHTTPKAFKCDIAPSITFCGFCFHKDILYLTTRTEVLLVDPITYAVLEIITHPLFNDIHDVYVNNNNLYVVVTGMDAVFSFDLTTRQATIINVLGKDPFHKYDRGENLNKLASIKPHESHPNHVFELENEIWVTRLKNRDAICLSNSSKRIDIGIGLPHDGIVKGEFIYFTTANGYIVVVDKTTKKTVKNIRLTGEKNEGGPLGWCRGLSIDDTHFYVGFTKLRTTHITENLDWAKKMVDYKKFIDKPLPTRIEKYTHEGKFVSQLILPRTGIYNIFGIQKLP